MLAFAFDCGVMLSEYPFFSNFYGRSDAKKAHGPDLDAFFAYFFVNTILELCKPRESIFQSNYTDDVISITNLTNGKISGSAFFEETYLTDGMKRLFDTAFRRFNGEDVTPIVRLKQTTALDPDSDAVLEAQLDKFADEHSNPFQLRYDEVFKHMDKVSRGEDDWMDRDRYLDIETIMNVLRCYD